MKADPGFVVGATIGAVLLLVAVAMFGVATGQQGMCQRFADRARNASDSAFVAGVCRATGRTGR